MDLNMKIQKLRVFYKLSKEVGTISTLRAFLDYLGIKNYSKIKYPNTDIKIRVRSKFIRDWKVVELGKYEPNCMKFLLDIVEKGQTIFDVGSGFGVYTLLFSSLTGPYGKVIAFEPSKSFNILLEHLKKNRVSNVFVENICLSDFIGEVKFKSYNQEIGETVMERFEKWRFGEKFMKRKDRKLETFTARSITIDEYCKKTNFAPDGMKIDVEGAEGLVLKGATKTIKSHHPWALVEFHGIMSAQENVKNWKNITRFAKEVRFIEGDDTRYSYEDEIKSRPEGCCHIFVRY